MFRRCSIILAGTLAVTAAGPALAGARTASDKLDSQLKDLIAANGSGSPAARIDTAHRDAIATTAQGSRAQVDVFVHGSLPAAESALRAAGMTISAATPLGPIPMVEGSVAVGSLPALAALPESWVIAHAEQGKTDTGSVTSQGDAVQRDPQARALGTVGAGVPVGVISDSINQQAGGVATSQGTGDLPAGVTVLQDAAGASDEGRAMSEIIYDEAPGISSFFFSSGTASGPAGKAASIANLASHGVKIIADDIYYLTEPMFQEGAVAQAVDAARAAGVTYFASAGNRARQSWEGTYVDNGGFNDFGGGTTTQTVATVASGSALTVTLQWAQPWGHATDELDEYLVDDSSPATVLAQSTTSTVGGNPVQTAVYHNTSGGPVTVGLQVTHPLGGGAPYMKWIANGGFGYSASTFDAINPDAASSPSSYAVAAVAYNHSGLNQPESYSSRGPVTLRFAPGGSPLSPPVTEQKPQLAAADCVSTTVPGFAPFCGTSAATPSAAGVAALVLSANGSLNPSQLGAVMTNPANAIDCLLPGNPDTDCGSGFIQADRAVTQALDVPGTPTATVAGVVGANGWYVTPPVVTWATSDPLNPGVAAGPGCAPAPVPVDGVIPVRCGVTNAVNHSATGTIVVKRDTTPPRRPVLSGIVDGRVYAPGRVPRLASIHCASADVTSGLSACALTGGYSTARGRHTLTAVAQDNAGLRSTSTLRYTVARFGLAALRTRRDGTAVLVINVPFGGRLTVADGQLSRRHPALIGATRRTAHDGAQITVRIRPTARARRTLRRHRPVRVVVLVSLKRGRGVQRFRVTVNLRQH